MIINGGTIENYGIYNRSTGSVEINDVTISSKAEGISNSSTGMITINKGTISCSSYGITNSKEGTIIVNNVEIIKGTTGISNSGTGTVNIKDATINSNTGIANTNSGIITIDNIKIDSTIYGIRNSKTGTVIIEDGTISVNGGSAITSFIYGIYNESTGIITIGRKDDGDIDKETPSIVAKYTGTYSYGGGYGLYNKLGTINFYDGVIQGSTRFAVGGIKEVEREYQIAEETKDGLNSIYLEEESKSYIAKNENTGEQYYSLKEAIEDIDTSEQTNIKVLQDFDLKSDFSIPENRNIILDLSGNIVANKYIQIVNNGNFEIKDTVGNAEINCNETFLGIMNCGASNFKLNGAILKCSGSVGAISDSNPNLDIYGIYNLDMGEITINDGMIDSRSSGSGCPYGIYNNDTGTIIINGGAINCQKNEDYNTYGIYNNTTGIVTMNNGMISSDLIGIYNNKGIITINDGKINVKSTGIRNNGNGTIVVNNGKIISESSWNSTTGVANYGAGIITIGIKGDGVVSDKNPSIISTYKGSTSSRTGIGINNSKGTLNFYDGMIQGSTRALSTTTQITEREEGTFENWQENETILTLSTTAGDIAQVGDTKYTDLQTAIDAAGSTATTIKLLRGINYTSEENPVLIKEGQNITLDLQGFSIISAINGEVFNNSGTFKITDNSGKDTGKVYGSSEKIIQNNIGATLELEKGTITRNNSDDYIIYNEGTMNVTGGKISSSYYGKYAIYNTTESTLNVNSGEIVGAIQNLGTVGINGGTVEKIENEGRAILEINDGMILGSITNTGESTILMTGGTIKDTERYSYYGITNTSTSDNAVTITGGTIEANKGTNYKAYGIYSTAGTVTIGTKDGNITEIPEIIGVTNAIYTTSKLDLYDGILRGGTAAVQGSIDSMEDNSEIVVSTETVDSTEYETIRLTSKDTKIANVGGTEYNTIYDAIENITTSGTVSIQRDGTVAEIIDNLSGKDITIDLNGHTLSLYNNIQNTGTLNITDSSVEKTGTITTYKDSPIVNSGTLKLMSGTISSNIYGIYNEQTGTVSVEGGSIKENTYGIYNVKGTVTVSGGNITENTYGTFTNGGTVNINDGEITSNKYGVYVSSGTTNITDLGLTGNTFDVFNHAGTVNITNSEITGTLEAAITNETSTATTNIVSGTIVSNAKSAIANKGTVVLGTEDGTVTNDTPVMQGEIYGIDNKSGIIKFYDGTIKGKTGAISGIYTYFEDGYTNKSEYVDNYYCDTLKTTGLVTPVAYIGSVGYTSLQSAINACVGDEATTIKLNNTIKNEPIRVEERQNIIIDLNGFGIEVSSAQYTINNAGNLSLIDSTDTGSEVEKIGKVVNTTNTDDIKGVAINNTGTLTLGTNDSNVSIVMPQIVGTDKAIITTGILNFYDGTITAKTPVDGTITNRASGYVINRTTTDGVSTLKLSK